MLSVTSVPLPLVNFFNQSDFQAMSRRCQGLVYGGNYRSSRSIICRYPYILKGCFMEVSISSEGSMVLRQETMKEKGKKG